MLNAARRTAPARGSLRAPFAALPREARDTLFTLALIAWTTLPQLGALPVWCSAAIAVVIVWRGRLACTGGRLPPRPLRIALLAAALAATWASYRTILGADAGVTLLACLLALKALELRARGDALVVFFLGFFVLLTGFLRSQSLTTAAIAVVGVLGLLTALVNAHRPAGTPTLRSSARIALRLTLAGTPVMVALFLFFPRFAPLWALPSNDTVGRSGLSSSMSVGDIATLALDDSIAFRVQFRGAPPPQGTLYFRGPVLEQFDGREWTAAGRESGAAATIATTGTGTDTDTASGTRYTTTLQPSDHHWLLALDGTTAAPRLPAGWQARVTPAGSWRSQRAIDQLLRYEAVSRLAPHSAATPSERAADLLLPAGYDPRTRALAQRLRAEAGSARAVVDAALERLRSGGYRYTLSPGLSGRDSADTFWFDTHAGFCEHIASAFVVLLRAAGIPARVVTGFQGGALNPVDSTWIVRNADAHAWTEVWLDAASGWVRVDPTAAVSPARIAADALPRAPRSLAGSTLGTLNPALYFRLRAVWDAANNRWNQWVLAYTQERQFALLQSLGFQAPDWGLLIQLLGALAAATAGAVVLWSRWQRPRPTPWLRLLARARRRLQRAGISAPASAGPRTLARSVATSTLAPEARAAIGAWLLALERQHYAAPAERAATLATLAVRFTQLPWPRPI